MSYIPTLLKTIDFSSLLYSFQGENNKPQVLDPLSCLIRLSLLNYKPDGTKLSFTNNKIVFQEPDLFQSAKRWSQGDNRQQIHNLYNPIFKIKQWYDVKQPEFQYILTIAKKGLHKLLKCYNSDPNVITHSINYYIETIDDILNEKNEKEKKDKGNNKMDETMDIYSIKLQKLWNLREIQLIHLLLQEIEEKFSNKNDKFNNIKSLMQSVEDIIIGKDDIVVNIVNKISTSL